MVVLVGPLGRPPAAELSSINPAVFGKLEHVLASIGTTGINAQGFQPAAIWIDAEEAVVEAKAAVPLSQFLKPVSDIDMFVRGAVLRTENQEFAGVMIVSGIRASGSIVISRISAVPSAIPVFVAPVGASPVPKLRSVKEAAVRKIKCPLLAIGPARIDSEDFRPPGNKISIEGVVLHAEALVMTCELPQSMGDVHMVVLGAVLRVENDILTGVDVMILRREAPEQHKESDCQENRGTHLINLLHLRF